MRLEVAVHFELRYAVRQLLKSPWFTFVAVAGLGLGIGANVALFSVINSIFLRPLPYPEPGRVVRLSSTNEAQNLTRVGFSYPRYREVEQRQQVFSDLALAAPNAFTWTGRGDPEQLVALHASASLLPALGLEPALGRNFSADEDRPGGESVVLISQRIWQERFNRNPSALGQALILNGAPYTIIRSVRNRARSPSCTRATVFSASRRRSASACDRRAGSTWLSGVSPASTRASWWASRRRIRCW